MIIRQGDQYAIAMKLKKGNGYITPTECDEMIIQINDKPKRYTQGEIIFDEEQQTWLYPLKFEDTIDMTNAVIQMKMFVNDLELNSNVKSINVEESIIKIG